MSGIVEEPRRDADACPDENEWVGYLDGTVAGGERARLQDHLDACDSCRQLAAAMVRATVPPDREPDPEERLPARTKVGRYVLLDLVGSGAMGMVYAAYDPELERKVALKFVRTDWSPGKSDPDGQKQLLAEAKAIARVTHPNIVGIYDVGTSDGELFFAMEFVPGTTLRQAASDPPGGWRSVLALYQAAGRGLQAAHAAGLVHRDFKPDNVLVGDDGRVLVSDFGLAAKPVAQRRTVRAGTPGYMAPEQWDGRAVDARSDQYSFCVALREALYGAPLKPPGSPEPLEGGEAKPWSGRIPFGVARALTRGLRADPGERWPSMEELLTALSRASRPVGPAALCLGTVVLLLAVVIWGYWAVMSARANLVLRQAAERLPTELETAGDQLGLRLASAGRTAAVLDALQRADDLDAALGLAPREDGADGVLEAHELLRSADLPELKSLDGLWILNAWGRVLYDLAREDRVGDAAPRVDLVMQALQGKAGRELWSPAAVQDLGLPLAMAGAQRETLLVMTHPVARGPVLGGALLGAIRVRARLLPGLERALGVEVLLRTADGAWAGTPPSPRPDATRGMQLVRQGQRTLALYPVRLPNREGGAAYVALPLDGRLWTSTAFLGLRDALVGMAILALLWAGWRWGRYA